MFVGFKCKEVEPIQIKSDKDITGCASFTQMAVGAFCGVTGDFWFHKFYSVSLLFSPCNLNFAFFTFFLVSETSSFAICHVTGNLTFRRQILVICSENVSICWRGITFKNFSSPHLGTHFYDGGGYFNKRPKDVCSNETMIKYNSIQKSHKVFLWTKKSGEGEVLFYNRSKISNYLRVFLTIASCFCRTSTSENC